ncbi:hypothetical protein GALMADRAFT_208873 [Galerina marginata CBS 339.88]|uniref:Uncharacterized protein n=1 Tax=Galerina marginata (strain CBS 339.88) TaxID=685588 RepID=A0A067TKQ9_GALM3|nr:hypothetical protein GALMADRAFT_208873 [Galerina marginata CBS 339.88]
MIASPEESRIGLDNHFLFVALCKQPVRVSGTWIITKGTLIAYKLNCKFIFNCTLSASFGSKPDRLQTCLTIVAYHEFLITVTQVVIGGIVILRTHAIYGRSRRILFLLVVVAVGVSAYGISSIIQEKGNKHLKSDLSSSGCMLPTSNNGVRGLAETWSGHVVFDTLVFLLTLYKSVTTKRQGFSILTVMLRDVSLSSHECPTNFAKNYLKGMTATTTNVLSSAMISRLMLNLRDPQWNTEHDTRQREEIILSNLVFEAGAEASTSASNKSFSGDEWTGLEVIHSTGGIHIHEDLPKSQGTHPNKADTFQSVEQFV